MTTWFTADLHLGHANIIAYTGWPFDDVESINRARFGDHRPADRGAWLLHGHVHERWAQRGRMINVGVDATAFRPISEGEIARVIRAEPEDRTPSTG